MKIQKVVRVEVSQDDEGNTTLNLIFGDKGAITSYFYEGVTTLHHLFVETKRLELDGYAGQPFAGFDGWIIPTPKVHPSETPEMAILAALEACLEDAPWLGYEYAPAFVDSFKPAQGSFQSHHEEA